MQKRTFIKNAAILTLTSLLLRAAGMGMRIYIAGQIGAEGMGLHALIFTVYTFASALATDGLSLAVTRLMAQDAPAGGKTAIQIILKKALPLALTLGCGAMLCLYIFADVLALHWLSDSRAALSLRILSLGLPFMSVSACFKGYFMARRNAKTPSDSQLLEQIIRILAVCLLLRPMAMRGLGYACAAIVLGNAVSEIAACIYLAVGYKKDEKNLTAYTHKTASVFPRLLAVFLPVAVTGHINTALHTAENLLVPQALTKFSGDNTLAVSQFGMLKGMAIPALFFPASFLNALSALLVPELSEYDAKKQKSGIARATFLSLRITFISALLIAGVFMTYPSEIANLLYKDERVGYLLVFLAPVLPFMYLESIATGLLHGLGQQMSTLRYNLANSALRICAVLFFVPRYGLDGFLWIMIASNLYTSLACLRRLIRVSGIRIRARQIALPVLCCALAILTLQVYKQFCTGLYAILGGIALFCGIFMLFAVLSGTVTPADFAQLKQIRKKR